MNTCQIYTDASFDDKMKIAACGYYLIINDVAVKHIVFTVYDLPTCGCAEIYSVILALKDMMDTTGNHVCIHTDYLALVDMINKDFKGSKRVRSYINMLRMSIQELKNKGNTFQIEHVKAHAGSNGGHHSHNSKVDKACRKRLNELRFYFKSGKNKQI